MKSISLSIFLVAIVVSSHVKAQDWARLMQEPQGNFYNAKAAFEQYWATEDPSQKGRGYKAFKRWENFVERRVYPSGDLSQLNLTAINFEDYLSKNQSSGSQGSVKGYGGGSNLVTSATFTAMGPFGAISGNAGGQLLKSGRLNFVTIDPTNSNNLWVGAPAGGLWKSTNGGVSWTTGTDNLSVIGCSDLAIDPNNTNVMYLATGDGDAGDTRSIGVLKSINGGATWTVTGLSNPVTTYRLIRRLIINPSNPQILLAATSSGIYRTTNGGSTWTQITTFSTYDLEFKPGDPNTVYAAGTGFHLSTNGGASFTQIATGIAVSGVNRMAIAVTPHDVNYVYVLASDNANSGLQGVYKSVNSGTSFTVVATSPNMLNGSSNGSGTGGQGWYDLCIAASPLDKNEVVIGGVNVWRTTDGGANWTLYGHWTGSGAPFTHADHHDLEYDPSGVLYNANDGTLYKRTASSSSWTELSNGMNISQIYRIGLSGQTANKWITGHQDNGTSIWNGTSYNAQLGGDGMDCFFDRSNDNNVFGEYQNGVLRRSTNGGGTWAAVTTGLTGTSPWMTPWKQDPQVANNIYVGRTDLFKSTNQGTSWTQLGSISGSGTIREFAVAPNNSLVIYVLKSSGIFKTVDGGVNWTNVTGTVPVGSALPEYVVIHPSDGNTAWVVCSGYSNANKVFKTTNGGSTWTNISSNLPNIPANCIVYEPGSNDRVYVGMDVGIYYRDNTSSTWTLYNAGLPNTPIADLEISPASPTLLYAATYGRGVWVASLVPYSIVPTSSFVTNTTNYCTATAITFSDQSSNTPNAWNWGVVPNTGVSISSPTAQNPVITFQSSGVYTVNFQAFSSNGPGTTVSQVYTITSSPSLILSSQSQTLCGTGSVSFSVSGAGSYTWSNGGGNSPVAAFSPTSNSVYTVTGASNGCKSTATVSVTTFPSSSISINGPNSVCKGTSLTLLANGATSYTWSNAATGPFISVSPTVTTTYSVMGTSANNCTPTASKLITVNPDPIITLFVADTIICNNSILKITASGASIYTWMPGGFSGSSVIYTPNSTTTYSCFGTDVNGCSGSSNINVQVIICEGINSITFDQNHYDIFPNPSKGKFILKSSGNAGEPLQIKVFSLNGKLVYEQKHNFNETESLEINLEDVAAGTYILTLNTTQKKSKSIRLIKE